LSNELAIVILHTAEKKTVASHHAERTLILHQALSGRASGQGQSLTGPEAGGTI